MKLPPRTRPKLDPPVASMGDIAFLLLIFFILVTVLNKESDIKWKQPKAEKLTEQEESNVTVSIDMDGQMFVGRKAIVNNDKNTLRLELESALSKAYPEADADKVVVVKIDARIPYVKFMVPMGEISKLGARMVLVGEEGAIEANKTP